jgi:hypothetical protein
MRNEAEVSLAADHLVEHGFALVSQVLSESQVARFRRLREEAVSNWCFASGMEGRPAFVPGALEHYPRAVLPVVAHPVLLGLAEALMGPVVRLDSVVLAGAGSVDPARRSEPVGWHRDRYGFFPNGSYNRPLALICFVYLQSMTEATGPLRVLPGSHRNGMSLQPAQLRRPQPEEALISSEAGDAVIIHHNLLHSGSVSVSDDERQFLGHVYTLTCFRAEDDSFDGPHCRALRTSARQAGDRRLARLLGDDDQLAARQNAGFVQPPAAWRDQDTAHGLRYGHQRRRIDQVRAGLELK